MSALAQFDGVLLDGLDFCSRVYRLFESIRNSPDGPSRFRMRQTQVEKKLLEELLPICTYVQANYAAGRYISVRWKDGTQTYDAELSQRGASVIANGYPETAYLEVTSVMHPKDYLARELLEREGGHFGLDGISRKKDGSIESIPVSYSNKEFIEKFASFFLCQIAKKESKPYPPDTTLIVQCTLNLPYLPDEWTDLVRQIEKALPHSQFREIFVYDPVGRYSHRFLKQGRTRDL